MKVIDVTYSLCNLWGTAVKVARQRQNLRHCFELAVAHAKKTLKLMLEGHDVFISSH